MLRISFDGLLDKQYHETQKEVIGIRFHENTKYEKEFNVLVLLKHKYPRFVGDIEFEIKNRKVSIIPDKIQTFSRFYSLFEYYSDEKSSF